MHTHRPNRHAIASGVLAIVALASPAAGGADSGPSQKIESHEIAKGRELATRLCATCHLNPGQGEKSGPEGIPGFYAVARRPQQTAEAIVSWLQSVPPMMPNHHLTQDEMVTLSQFIMSLRDEKAE